MVLAPKNIHPLEVGICESLGSKLIYFEWNLLYHKVRSAFSVDTCIQVILLLLVSNRDRERDHGLRFSEIYL